MRLFQLARSEVWADVRYGARAARHRPLLAVTVIATLAMGIGAAITVFSLVNGIVLEPLAYPNAPRLMTVEQAWQGRAPGPGSISPAEYFDYLDEQHAFTAFGVYTTGAANLAAGEQPEQVAEGLVSGGVFAALGTRPRLGRTIGPADDIPGATPVAVIGSGLWQRQFAGDPSVIGRPIMIDGHAATIVGVLPDAFRLPDELASPSPSEIFVPLQLDRGTIRIRGSHFLSSVASLAPGVSPVRAQASIASLARGFATRFPADYPAAMQFAARAVDLRTAVVGATRPILLFLLAAVGCVFVVACVNVAGLLLAQIESRRVELAVRAALGASRARLVRQLLAESGTLAAVAGACGVALAAMAVRVLARRQPMHLPRLATLALDWHVAAFAVIATTVAAAACALLPARRMLASVDLEASIRAGGRGTSGGPRGRDARRTLVVGEIALAAVLLFGAALLATSFRRLLAVDPGFRVEHVLTVPLSLPDGTYPSDASVIQLYDELSQTIAGLPGVRAAGAVAGVPLEAPRGDMGIELEGHPVPQGAVHPKADWQVVTPGYFDAIGMRLRAGRLLTDADRAGARGVVVINETMAHRYWPGGNAIDHRFALGGGAKPDTVTVVGIVDDVRQAGLAATPDAEMYLAQSQFRFWGGGGIERAMSLVVRSTGDPIRLAPAVRRVVHDLAPTVGLGPLRTMRELRRTSVAAPRFMMQLLLASAAVTLLIAVVGVYGLVAFTVQQRRREFGIRLALGAQRGDIATLVLRDSVTMALWGVAIGVPAALAFSRLLRQWLYAVTATSPPLLVGVPLLLAAVALAAGYLPARRAARADPMTVVRAD